MTRFDYPEEGRAASFCCSENRPIAYCCAIYDNITCIQWHVFREMEDKHRFVVDGGGYNYEPVDSDMDSVFNFIVNEDECEHELCFDFIGYRYEKKDVDTFSANAWEIALEEWIGWIERGRKDE